MQKDQNKILEIIKNDCLLWHCVIGYPNPLSLYFLNFQHTSSYFPHTGGPHYMRKIGSPKIGSHIMNSHVKIPKITTNHWISSREKDISKSHICEISDRKTTFNEGRLFFLKFQHSFSCVLLFILSHTSSYFLCFYTFLHFLILCHTFSQFFSTFLYLISSPWIKSHIINDNWLHQHNQETAKGKKCL